MEFFFDIDKSIAATAYVVKTNGGAINVLPLVKVLYYANRNSLVRHGRSITGDRFIAMRSGPNVSETYSLISGSRHADPAHLKKWNQFFAKDHHAVRLKSEPTFDSLSGSELKLLSEGLSVISTVKGRIDEWSHQFFPEWSEPKGRSKSKTIAPDAILRHENKSASQIEEIADELHSLNWLKAIAK